MTHANQMQTAMQPTRRAVIRGQYCGMLYDHVGDYIGDIHQRAPDAYQVVWVEYGQVTKAYPALFPRAQFRRCGSLTISQSVTEKHYRLVAP